MGMSVDGKMARVPDEHHRDGRSFDDQKAQHQEIGGNPAPGIHLTQRVVSMAGVDVNYQVTGCGEPVVLVHGLSGSSRMWIRNISALAGSYMVYLVDLPGFGSLHRFPQRLMLSEMASWLLDWMDALHLERIRLVGYSMGGALAIQAAAQRPDAIEQLVLAAPAAIPSGHMTLRSYLLPLAATLTTSTTFLPILAHDALRAGPRTLLRISRNLLAEDAREDLKRISAPTLLIWGRRDALVPPSLGPLMRQALPHADLVILEGVGHLVMYEHAEAFNAAMLAFFAGQPMRERPSPQE